MAGVPGDSSGPRSLDGDGPGNGGGVVKPMADVSMALPRSLSCSANRLTPTDTVNAKNAALAILISLAVMRAPSLAPRPVHRARLMHYRVQPLTRS